MRIRKPEDSEAFMAALLRTTEGTASPPDEDLLRRLHEASAEAFKDAPARRRGLSFTASRVWRMLMRNAYTKAAAALVLLLVAGFSLAVVSQLGRPDITISVWFDKLLVEAGEAVTLNADLSHRGKHPLERQGGFHLEVNDVWYDSPERGGDPEPPRVFRPGTDYRDMVFPLDGRWTIKETGQALKLEPGRYRVRLALAAREAEAETEAELWLASNVAEIRILEPGSAATEREWLELAAGGQVGTRYSAEEVAAKYREEYGREPAGEDLAAFYYQKTFELGQRGILGPKGMDMALVSPRERARLSAATDRTLGGIVGELLAEAAECALAFEHDDLTTLRLHMYLGDACWRQTVKYTPVLWGRQRRVAAIAYLAGLRYALGLDLPGAKPERSGVFLFRHDGQELLEPRLLRVARAVARNCDRVRDLVDARQVLAQQIVAMYARDPEAPEELHRLVADRIGSERIAEYLAEGVQAHRKGKGPFPPPLPALLAEAAGEEGPDATRHGVVLQGRDGGRIEAGFVPDKEEVLLGEPLFLTFYVKNAGDVPHRLFLEGFRLFDRDPPAASPRRFHIAAVSDTGEPVKEPAHPADREGGESPGRAGKYGDEVSLEVGSMYAERLFLGHWLILEKAGSYTITCSSTLKAPDSKEALPVAVSFNLRVTPRDEAAVKEIVAAYGMQVSRGENMREGVFALSQIDAAETMPHLAAALKRRTDPQSMCMAIRGLSRFPVEPSVDALVGALATENADVFAAAAEALHAMGKDEAVVDELIQASTSGEDSVRLLAVRALGSIGSGRAFAPLVAALEDRTAAVRHAALEALGKLRDPGCIEVLKRYVGDADLDGRFVAVKALAAQTKSIDPAWLVPILKTSGINDPKFHESIRLARIYGKEQAARALVSCLELEDPSPRNQRNFFLIMAIEACPGGPKYFSTYRHDPNSDGTPEEIEGNRAILLALKAWLAEQAASQEKER